MSRRPPRKGWHPTRRRAILNHLGPNHLGRFPPAQAGPSACPAVPSPPRRETLTRPADVIVPQSVTSSSAGKVLLGTAGRDATPPALYASCPQLDELRRHRCSSEAK